MTLSRTPNLNLGAVVRETGLAADTLRAWERRYGLPLPQRTRGGHRLYSEWDTHVVKWLIRQQTEGLSISRAVGRWNELVASGTDPLNEGAAGVAVSPPPLAQPELRIHALRGQWLKACLAYDEASAEQALNQAFGLFPAEDVVTDVIQESLHEVGEMWLRGGASVQQEHFMSSLATRRLDALIEAAPPPVRPETVLLACPETELHSLPLQFLHLLLRRGGRRVVFLGANVPVAHLEATVRNIQPRLVVMAAQQLTTASGLRETATLLQTLGVPTAFAGRVFNLLPGLRDKIAGTYLGEEIKGAPGAIDEVLVHPPLPGRRIQSGPVREAQSFREAQPQIEANVQKRFAREALPARHLITANRFLGAALGAALDFRNVKYLEADIEWVRVLLGGQGFPEANLRDYLLAYAHAVRRVMRDEAGEIAGWIEDYGSSL